MYRQIEREETKTETQTTDRVSERTVPVHRYGADPMYRITKTEREETRTETQTCISLLKAYSPVKSTWPRLISGLFETPTTDRSSKRERTVKCTVVERSPHAQTDRKRGEKDRNTDRQLGTQ